MIYTWISLYHQRRNIEIYKIRKKLCDYYIKNYYLFILTLLRKDQTKDIKQVIKNLKILNILCYI